MKATSETESYPCISFFRYIATDITDGIKEATYTACNKVR
jgi:hypothetical protein